MEGWGCELEEVDAWFGQFSPHSVMEFLEVLGSTALRRLKLLFETHYERLVPRLFEEMSASSGEETPLLPNLETLILEDTALFFSPDVVIQMLESRWNAGLGDLYPLRECVVHTRNTSCYPCFAR
jgi:hypothetical protein